jgi:hypothetical protein
MRCLSVIQTECRGCYQEQALTIPSSHIILGVYLIIFGLGKSRMYALKYGMLTTSSGNALLEFQIPQQVARYASFMFSFLGRGICKHFYH